MKTARKQIDDEGGGFVFDDRDVRIAARSVYKSNLKSDPHAFQKNS